MISIPSPELPAIGSKIQVLVAVAIDPHTIYVHIKLNNKVNEVMKTMQEIYVEKVYLLIHLIFLYNNENIDMSVK